MTRGHNPAAKTTQMARQTLIDRDRILAVTGALKRFLSFRAILALALILWCAGTGCMLVGYAREANSPAVESESPAVENMAGMPACHAKRHKPQNAASSKGGNDKADKLNLPSPSRSGSMSCCPLTTRSIAAASRPQANDPAPALSNSNSELPNLVRATNEPVAIPLRLPNRAHSYLLGCAFLI